MEILNRTQIADYVFERLKDNQDLLKNHFMKTGRQVGYFVLDDLLPEEIVHQVYNCFPKVEETTRKKSLKEYKYVAAQMDKYHPLLEETIYAFQDSRVVQVISDICGYSNMQPDDHLYAGGISMMGKGNYLQPHLDNSHDKDRNLWRVLNLLYYVTPDWKLEYGGNLELWPDGLKEDPVVIASKYNRLVVMATHQTSWHSVNKVEVDKIRACVSNYYFSETPIGNEDFFHVTTFRGRPGQYLRNSILKLDSTLRMGIRKLFKKGIKENPHVYKKKD